MHPIASWMVALDFADRLTVQRHDPDQADAEEASVFDLSYVSPSMSEAGADAARRRIDWPLDHDLAFRAHALVERHAGRPLRVRVTLVKRIPTGAGLGGGSSDAAGMIVALDHLFALGLNTADKRNIADQLGSDVHFALAVLNGTPSAIVTGWGDAVEPAPLASAPSLVLVMPPFGCPTGRVYAAFDRFGLGRGRVDAGVLRGLTTQAPVPASALFNDLEPAACEVEPRLATLLRTLRNDLGFTAHVTGSGAACFVIADSVAAAERIADTIRQRTGFPALVATTLAGHSRVD